MRTLIANAAPVPYALKQELIEKLGDGFLYEVYGSTELGVVTVLAPGRPAAQARVVRQDVRPDRGAHRARRRHRGGQSASRASCSSAPRSRWTATTTPTSASREHDGDWKSVGDVAYLDDEGYLYICDRKKDMIISGGVNIYPAEIEAVIHEHPAILDVAVFGVPDDEWGERVHAIVQPRAGRDASTSTSCARFVEERVGGYKRPRDYEVRDELPRTESGKLLKRVLRDEFWGDRETAV